MIERYLQLAVLITGPFTTVMFCLPNMSAIPLLLFLSALVLLPMLTDPQSLLLLLLLLLLLAAPGAPVDRCFDFSRISRAVISGSRFIGSGLTVGGLACAIAHTETIAKPDTAFIQPFMIYLRDN
jgi:hypothetical protein